MAAKPITELAEDLRKFVEEGRAQAGPRIVFALQHEGPWWTGTFGKSWKLSATKVRPVNSENVEQIGAGGAPKRVTFWGTTSTYLLNILSVDRSDFSRA